MIVISPNDSSHTIKVIPRTLNIDNDHTFALTNDDTRVSVDVSNTKVINGGYIDYVVNITNTEGQSYSLKITDDITTLVVWRGKIFCTTQITQTYKING